MARFLHVTPKATLSGSTWDFLIHLAEFNPVDGSIISTSKTRWSEPAGVTAEVPIVLLKIAFDLTVADTDTDQIVVDAFRFSDIRPGPQTETVMGNWQLLAETIIGGLGSGYSYNDFKAAWTPSLRNSVVADIRTLIKDEKWTVDVGSVHYHDSEGSGDV